MSCARANVPATKMTSHHQIQDPSHNSPYDFLDPFSFEERHRSKDIMLVQISTILKTAGDRTS
jgi:hypothetical protein